MKHSSQVTAFISPTIVIGGSYFIDGLLFSKVTFRHEAKTVSPNHRFDRSKVGNLADLFDQKISCKIKNIQVVGSFGSFNFEILRNLSAIRLIELNGASRIAAD